jgi:hypothetical protein
MVSQSNLATAPIIGLLVCLLNEERLFLSWLESVVNAAGDLTAYF